MHGPRSERNDRTGPFPQESTASSLCSIGSEPSNDFSIYRFAPWPSKEKAREHDRGSGALFRSWEAGSCGPVSFGQGVHVLLEGFGLGWFVQGGY